MWNKLGEVPDCPFELQWHIDYQEMTVDECRERYVAQKEKHGARFLMTPCELIVAILEASRQSKIERNKRRHKKERARLGRRKRTRSKPHRRIT